MAHSCGAHIGRLSPRIRRFRSAWHVFTRKSQEYTFKKRSTLSEIDDPYGPWFDGVAYLQSQNHSDTFVAGKKDQKIAILGGGMAGLMSGLLLDQVGIHNWEISESSDRIGGYVRSTVFADGTGDFVPPT